MRQLSLQQWTVGQLCQASFEDLQRNVNSILTSNTPYGVGERTLRISCLRWRTKPDGDIERLCSRRWELNGIFQNRLPNVAQCVSQYGHALANTQPLLKPPRSGRRHQHGGTTYIDMQKVGCALIQDVRGTVRASRPALHSGIQPLHRVLH